MTATRRPAIETHDSASIQRTRNQGRDEATDEQDDRDEDRESNGARPTAGHGAPQKDQPDRAERHEAEDEHPALTEEEARVADRVFRVVVEHPAARERLTDLTRRRCASVLA